ncbi:MAG TPA: glycoside hydrolase family 3 N-terminal domain-containing protein [Tetrasphaera sp.]|nr:glycoside hydrolase family 3 N-terminal domain-containing protein [Tetrasphaera sp.]
MTTSSSGASGRRRRALLAGLITGTSVALGAGACTPSGTPSTGASSTSASRPPATSASTTAGTATAGETTSNSSSSSSASTSVDPIGACVDTAVAGLSEEEQIGQLLMVGLDAGAGARGVDSAVTEHHVGGVILLGGWSGAATVTAVTEHLNSIATGPKLFLAADQEGGQVQQLKGAGFSTIPSATQQATLGPAALREAATDWAQELVDVGINVNLAPVADTVPADIGTANGPIGRYHREYGSTPAAVIPPMTAFLEGMHDGEVMTAVKHFPGIGRIRGNTDSSATGITDPTTTLDDPYLEPFRAGIDAGTDFVMVSSAAYPKIAAAQALFAPEIVTDLLRTRLGYDGVVITDDVGAAAAVAATPIGERATKFIAAGGDIVLTAKASDIPVMARAVKAELADEEFAAKAGAALERVLTLKARRGLLDCS